MLGAAAVLAYGWWATGLPGFSAIATVAVVGAGAVAMAGAARRGRRVAPRVRSSELVPWLVLFGALAAVQAAAYLQGPRSHHPTLSSLANAALDTHLARALAFAAWIGGCVHLARR